MVVAYDVDLLGGDLDVAAAVVVFVLLDVGEVDGDGEMVGMAGEVLSEIDLLDEVAQVELDILQYALMVLSRHPHIDLLQRIPITFHPRLHRLAMHHHINLFFFLAGIRQDHSWTQPFLSETKNVVTGFAQLGHDDVFVFVEDGSVEEGASGGAHVELRHVLGEEVDVVAGVGQGEEQGGEGLLCHEHFYHYHYDMHTPLFIIPLPIHP